MANKNTNPSKAEVGPGSQQPEERANITSSFLPASGNPDISVTILEPDTDGGWDGSSSNSDTGNLRGSANAPDSATDFHFQHGRRYHSSQTGKYELPNDEGEQSRLNLQHHIFRKALDGRLYTAPLPKEKIHNVLDIGCGTGIWCVSTAKELPHAKVEGIDLSPIQPKDAPPNCTFSIRDANDNWPTQGQKYDLIHTAAMTLGITDWPKLMRQVFEALRPGGYLEFHEYSARMGCLNAPQGPNAFVPYMVQMLSNMAEGMVKTGRDWHAIERADEILKEVGFVGIDFTYQDWPVGTWAKGTKNKEIGYLSHQNLTDAVHNVGKIFTGALGWSEEDFREWQAEAVKDIENQKWQVYMRVYFIVARKPGNE